jgi:hypothetical protein
MLETIGIIGLVIAVTMLARYLGRIHHEAHEQARSNRKEVIDSQIAAWEKEDELKGLRK